MYVENNHFTSLRVRGFQQPRSDKKGEKVGNVVFTVNRIVVKESGPAGTKVEM